MRPRSIRYALLLALFALPAWVTPASAEIGLSSARGFVPRQVIVKYTGEDHSRTIGIPRGVGVRNAAARLERDPRVEYAAPNFIARASAPALAVASARKAAAPFLVVPNDPGPIVGTPGPPGGWVSKQWNFLPWEGQPTPELPTSAGGINAVAAWQNLIAMGRPGAQGVKIAILDTGIAYRALGKRYKRSPDFTSGQFAKGWDFVDGDALPLDDNGHGTHVAATIGEKTNNGVGLTGLAYRANLVPVRVLDEHGSGRANQIAAGIRFAVASGADIINMSFNFACGKRLPAINEELRRAYAAGVLVVASVGNVGSEQCVAPPATGPHVVGVAGTTQGGCLGSYSLAGHGVDLLAPGGGAPVAGCPSVLAAPIYQVTLKSADNPRVFSEPGGYAGTSMAAAHVSGAAALVLASKVTTRKLKDKLLVTSLSRRLAQTARDLGLPRRQQGAGLIDAGRATDPSCCPTAARR